MIEHPNRNWIVFLMFFSFLHPGCLDDVNKPLANPNYCNNSLDCEHGKRCDNNVCTQIANSLAVVHFELIPSKESLTTPTQIPNVDLKVAMLDSSIDLELSEAIHITHEIKSPSFDKKGVSGTLIVNRLAEISTRPLTWNIQASKDGVVKMDLPTGHYNMHFKPLDRKELPHVLLSGLTLTNQIELPIQYPLYPETQDLDKQETLMLVRGRILLEPEVFFSASQLKVEGISRVNGIMPYDLYTNLATPDNDGLFYLRLPLHINIDHAGNIVHAYPKTMTLVVRPKSNDILAPIISIKIALDTPDLGDFFLGDIPKSIKLSGIVTDADGNPIPFCQLWFESNQIGNGALAIPTGTDEMGLFSISLLIGDYSATLLPGLTIDARMTSFDLQLTDNVKDLQFDLKKRPRFKGAVFDDQGRRIPGVIVRARRLIDSSFSRSEFQRTFETTTTDSGDFELATDSGTYKIIFIPPATEGLPRSLPISAVTVDNISNLPSESTTLPRPNIVQGQLTHPEGKFLCSVTVDVFHVDDQGDPQLIGKTISGQSSSECDGAFTVIIPELPPQSGD